MKKALSLVFAVLLLVALPACSDASEENELTTQSSQSENELATQLSQSENELATQLSQSENETISMEQDDSIPIDELYMKTGYNDGLAFADYEREIICIDKKGRLVFKLPEEYDIVSETSGFCNGIAAIEFFDDDYKPQIHFCRKDGTIIKPEDVGATSFAIGLSDSISISREMFEDGYIIAYNIHLDEEGLVSTREAGVLSPDMEWYVPLSESFYNTVMTYDERSYIEYNAGYAMIFGYGYLDLRTGLEETDFSKLYSNAEVTYKSDFWSIHNGEVYDDREGRYNNRETVMNLSIYEDICVGYDFEQGIAPVFFGQSPEYKFSLLREDGTLCFDPVLVMDSTSQSYDGSTGLYLVAHGNDSGALVLDIFDVTGRIKTYTLDKISASDAWAFISDDVICITYMRIENDVGYFENILLTTDFDPLF